MDADVSSVKRFLCSDLVGLRIGGRQRFVNLEEIWRTGAVLESEEDVTSAGPASLVFNTQDAGTQSIAIAIEGVERHEFGWRLEVKFLDTEWTPELYTPAHLTDIENIGAAAERGKSAG